MALMDVISTAVTTGMLLGPSCLTLTMSKEQIKEPEGLMEKHHLRHPCGLQQRCWGQMLLGSGIWAR